PRRRRPRRQVSVLERAGRALRPRAGKPRMNGFSPDWLALREPYDLAARNAQVLDTVANAFLGQAAISVVDLACGAGATLRAVGPHLPPRQSWRLVDNSLSLLARAFAPEHPPYVNVTTTPLDLARDLELALDGPLDLVTASALLDLVSPEWLDRLVVEAAARRLPVYAALSYDGRVVAEPGAPFDAEMVAGLNKHQLTDKGFGPALGPDAAASATARFARAGYQAVTGRPDGLLGGNDHNDRSLQDGLFGSWADLAPLFTTLPADDIAQWLADRRRCLAQGRSTLRVGHIDLFARP